MRLICPNCGAQYEVPDDVIPSAGRDVQCSSCAHTWFETPGASEAREAGEADARAAAAAREPEPVSWEDASTEEAPAEAPHTETKTIETAVETTDDQAPTEESDTAPEPAEAETEESSDAPSEEEAQADEETEDASSEGMPERKPLPSSVSDILREEAKREEAKREADESGGLESQPDLGLDRPLSRDQQLAEEARRRMARLKGEAAPAIGAATATAAGARSDLLPDIDEINSSLRSETDRGAKATSDTEEKPKSGFRRGFMTVVILALLALAVYIAAPRLIEAVPALEQPLTQYVDAVDRLRLWLDLQLQGLMGDGAEET